MASYSYSGPMQCSKAGFISSSIKQICWLFGAVILLVFAPFPQASAQGKSPQPAQTQNKDARAGSKEYDQSIKLLRAIDALLEETAHHRKDARKLPSDNDYLVTAPPWTETKEDRAHKIRELLDAALEVVTEAPVVAKQKEIATRRKEIEEIKTQISQLKEKRLDAPADAMLPGILTDTVASIDEEIADLKTRISENEKSIQGIKKEIHKAMSKSGVEMTPTQIDLLLDSVLGSDLVKLVAAFNAAKAIDTRLGSLLGENSENLKAARRYFAMHAALFAMLLHAQDQLVEKIDRTYLPRLKAILKDVKSTRRETNKLLRTQNRADQRRTLESNLKAQDFAERVAEYYRDYLKAQRDQIIQARKRTRHDLRIADNTFETVEASFQLRALIKDARASFDAIQRLDTPGFDQIFKNKELRKEFENLTRKLAPPSS